MSLLSVYVVNESMLAVDPEVWGAESTTYIRFDSVLLPLENSRHRCVLCGWISYSEDPVMNVRRLHCSGENCLLLRPWLICDATGNELVAHSSS